MKLTRRAWARMHSAAWSGQSTYSQIGSRGEAWYRRDLAALVGGIEPGEEVARRRGHPLAGPAHGGRGRRGEGRDVERVERRQVVVADQADVAALAHEGRALVGLSAVADHVAEAPGLLDAGVGDLGEHRLERGQIGVDVAEQGETHL